MQHGAGLASAIHVFIDQSSWFAACIRCANTQSHTCVYTYFLLWGSIDEKIPTMFKLCTVSFRHTEEEPEIPKSTVLRINTLVPSSADLWKGHNPCRFAEHAAVTGLARFSRS